MARRIPESATMGARMNDGTLAYDTSTDSYVITTSKPLSDEDKKKLSSMTAIPIRFRVLGDNDR